MTTRSRLDESLKTLDCATPLTAAQQQRATSTLTAILATAPGPAAPVRRLQRRWLPVAAAVLAGALFLLPGGLGGGRAYASWTAVPAALTGTEIALIGPPCRAGLSHSALDVAQASLVLAERRGEYAVLLYRTENPDLSGSCLVHNVPGSDDVDDLVWGAGSGSGTAQTVPSRGYTQGAMADFRDASVTDGAVGAEVAGVTIHARDLTVQASVANGRYVAWWPGSAFGEPDADTGSLELLVTYDLTLRDGSVIRDATPSLTR